MVAPTELTQVPYGELLEEHAKIDGKWIDFSFRRAPEPTDRHIIVVPGHSGIEPAYFSFRDELAAVCNADVLTYAQQRMQPFPLDLHPFHWIHPDRLNKLTIISAIDLLTAAFPEDKPDLVGHSMGGTNSVDAALRRSDRIGSIVFLASAGFEKGQSLARLASRGRNLASQEGRTILKSPTLRDPRMFGAVIVHNFINPLRTTAETIEVAHRVLTIKELRTLKAAGILLYGLFPKKDSFFPPEKQDPDLVGVLDASQVILDLDHLAPQSHPQLIAEYARDILYKPIAKAA